MAKSIFDIAVFYNAFPSKLSGFSYAESTWILERYENSCVFSNGDGFGWLEKGKSLADGFRAYAAEHKDLPNIEKRLKFYKKRARLNAKMLYGAFLNETYRQILPAAEKNKIPFAFTLYPGGGFCPDVAERDDWLRKIFSSPWFRKVIVTQQYTKDYLIRKNLARAEDIKLVFGVVSPKPRPLPHVYYNQKPVSLLFVAHKYRDVRQKGYDLFVEAAKIISARHPEAEFNVVGNWTADDCDASGIKNIKFHGLLDHDAISKLYSTMDIIVSPNDSRRGMDTREFDGFPTGSATDAALNGVAMFVSDPLGMNDGDRWYENGKEIEIISLNPAEIADRVEFYIKNSEKLKQLALAGQKKSIQLYSYEAQMLPRFEVFDEVIGKAKIRKHKFVTKLIKTLNANERHKFTDTNWLPTFRDKKFSIRGLFPKKKWTMERILKHNPHLAQVCEFYDQLSDDQSRDLLVRLSAYKILGGGKVRLPLYNKKIWKENFHDLEKICTPANDGRTSVIGDFGFYDLKKYGYDLNLYYNKLGTMLTFMLQQYKYKDICAVRPGDVVIDGGACYGDTALYFADKAGKGGKVYAWEFVDDNISVMNKNMELNSHLKNIIEIVRRPMGRNSTDELYASGVGPGSRLDDKPARGGVKHTTLSIDDFAKENDLEKLDFIKMDIEGAEADSIRGAARTIAKFKPNLAICIYHKADDYAVIPKLIKEINPDYEFYIGHFTVQGWETVLYAVDRNRGKK